MLYICGDKAVLIPEVSDFSFKLNQSSPGCHCTLCFQHNGKWSPWLWCDADQTGESVSDSIIQIPFGSSQKASVEVALLIPATSTQPHWVEIPIDSLGLQAEWRFMLFQYIIYNFHNRSYGIISDKGQYFKFGKFLAGI